MDYVRLIERIKKHIEASPSDHTAYVDFLSACRQWEAEDFAAAHAMNRELRKLSAAALRVCSAKAAESIFDVYKKAMCFDAPFDFDTFLLYMEMNRKPEKKFYMPRRHYLNFYSRPCERGDFGKKGSGKSTLLFLLTPLREGRQG